MIYILRILAIINIFSCVPAAAQISVGTSSQMQIGWSGYNRSTNRYTNVVQRGTSGENITPEKSDSKFHIYGSTFKVKDKTLPFDYSSIANNNRVVTDIQEDNFSVFGSYSGISTRSTKPSLGWFGKGNSIFSR